MICGIITVISRYLQYGTADLGVAQLVARYLGVVEAVCSSHITQTNKTPIL